MTRKIALFAVALLLTTMGMGRASAAYAAPAHQTGPQTWTVLVGGQAEIEKTDQGVMAGAWQFMKFYPNKITVHEGICPAPGQNYVPFVTPQGNPPTIVVNPLAVTPTGGPNYDGTAVASSG